MPRSKSKSPKDSLEFRLTGSLSPSTVAKAVGALMAVASAAAAVAGAILRH